MHFFKFYISKKNCFNNYDELICSDLVDAIYIATLNNTHLNLIKKCSKFNKHILCEKPLAISVEECVKMIDAAKAIQVILVEAFTHRWNSHLIKARRLVSEGVIGKVQTLESALCFHVKDPKKNVRFSKSLVEVPYGTQDVCCLCYAFCYGH